MRQGCGVQGERSESRESAIAVAHQALPASQARSQALIKPSKQHLRAMVQRGTGLARSHTASRGRADFQLTPQIVLLSHHSLLLQREKPLSHCDDSTITFLLCLLRFLFVLRSLSPFYPLFSLSLLAISSPTKFHCPSVPHRSFPWGPGQAHTDAFTRVGRCLSLWGGRVES